MSNRNIWNQSAFYNQTESNRVFDNPVIIGIVLLISLIFVTYAIYVNINTNAPNIKKSSTYYGKELAFYTPLFNETKLKVEDCIAKCENDLTCDGITYNSNTQYCTGTKGGEIRSDTSNYSAWVKPVFLSNKNPTTNIIKSILIGNTRAKKLVVANKLAEPYNIGNYSYSFILTIFDFYNNFGVWRHIFHKGTEIDDTAPLNYQSWETLTAAIPNQTIGVWVAPFSNNLRFAITTTSVGGNKRGSYADAYVQRCSDITSSCYVTDLPNGKYVDKNIVSDGSVLNTNIIQQIEYFDHDLKNIPLNTQTNFTINFNNRNVEIFMNGKLIKNTQLSGTPNFNKSNLYAMYDKTINGELKNLLYFPQSLTLVNIKNVMALSN